MSPVADKEVVIIGNGPAGLALSSFLSGVSPFYCGPHPDPVLHDRLSENAHLSLLDQDLSWVSGWDELSSSLRPINAFYDQLVRPAADLGELRPSSLEWRLNPDKAVDHLVLGDTAIGGSWNGYDKEMAAVSYHSWLNLPGYSIGEWLGDEPPMSRIPAVVYCKYMEKYAKHLGIRKHFRPHSRVTSITKEGHLWRIKGAFLKCGVKWQTFNVTAKRVVMACGKTKIRRLQVEGEGESKNIAYDMKCLRKKLTRLLTHRSCPSDIRVVVVGDGISSADMVHFCLSQGVRVLHVIKKSEKQLRATVMSRLSASHYPEYHQVHRLMTGRETNELYERRTDCTATRLSDGCATVSGKGNGFESEEPYNLLGVCIGRESDGAGLLDKKYTFDGYQCREDATLLSVGSFAGDHFVRYLVGGCLEVARGIHSALGTPPSVLDADPAALERSFCSSSSNSSDSLPFC
ncbi:unnamed protein product, partial [Mesorhabditis spiculigera]